jgi:penicillin-binding protein 1A
LRGSPLTETERSQLLDLLRAVVMHGSGRGAIRAVPTFGKTGTSQDHRDAWFIGFVDDLVVAVWVGRDDSRPMNGITGGALPVQIWSSFMTRAGYPAGTPGAPYETAPTEYEVLPFQDEMGDIPLVDEFGDAPPMFGEEPPAPGPDSGYLELPRPFPGEAGPPLPPPYRDRPRFEDMPPPPPYRDRPPRFERDRDIPPPPPRGYSPDEAPPIYDENAVG